MAFTPAIQQRILDAVGQKTPVRTCPLCGTRTWTLVEGFVAPLVQDEPSGMFALGGKTLPCVAISCTNCGNIQLLNLIALGITPEEISQIRAQELQATVARFQNQGR